MRDNDTEGRVSSTTLAAILCAFLLLFALFAWGPWSGKHVAGNDGPSGTPGSTAIDQTPPPAAGPSGSGTTTGSAR
jgi:hypothetical protein